MEDSHARRRRELVPLLETQLEYLFVARRLEPKTISFADAFDTQFGYHFAVRSGKGPVDCVTTTMVDFSLENRTKQAPAQYCWRACVQEPCRGGIASWRKKTVLDHGVGGTLTVDGRCWTVSQPAVFSDESSQARC